MDKYYQPSGRFSPLSFLYFLVACLLIFPILATIYAYCIWYIPFPYINFFIAAAFGFGVGFAVNYLAVRLGKVRNSMLAMAFGVIGALVAMYFHWAVWVDLVINAGESYGSDRIGVTVSNIKLLQVVNLALQPGALFSIIGEIKEFGTWGIRGNTVSGTPLMIIWIIEALIIGVFAFFTGFGSASEPFCEENQQWFDQKTLAPFEYIADPTSVVSSLERGDADVFKELKRAGNAENANHSVFTLFSNETRKNYLSIENKLASVNDKGEVKFDGTEVVQYIKISEELSNALEGIS